jgi:hypothetical protein
LLDVWVIMMFDVVCEVQVTVALVSHNRGGVCCGGWGVVCLAVVKVAVVVLVAAAVCEVWVTVLLESI